MSAQADTIWVESAQALFHSRSARDKLAAVCGYRCTGDEPSVIARQEGDAFGNLLRLAEAADRNLRNDTFEDLLRDSQHHFRVDVAGRCLQIESSRLGSCKASS